MSDRTKSITHLAHILRAMDDGSALYYTVNEGWRIGIEPVETEDVQALWMAYMITSDPQAAGVYILTEAGRAALAEAEGGE